MDPLLEVINEAHVPITSKIDGNFPRSQRNIREKKSEKSQRNIFSANMQVSIASLWQNLCTKHDNHINAYNAYKYLTWIIHSFD
jgi:hypothetical protein